METKGFSILKHLFEKKSILRISHLILNILFVISNKVRKCSMKKLEFLITESSRESLQDTLITL